MKEESRQTESDFGSPGEAPPRGSDTEAGDPGSMGGDGRENDSPGDGSNNSPIQYWTRNVVGDRTLADRAYAAIHDAILDGTFESGRRLRIEDLSATLHISPTPVREALSRLEAVGLAEHIPHHGTRVSTLSAVEFRELYELRLILESLAISKAAERFSLQAGDAARGHLERLAAAVRNNAVPEVQEAHTAFHFALYAAAQSRWLSRLIIPLWDSCRRYRFQPNNLRTNPAQNELEHQKILQACIAHDPKAAATELYNHTVRNANLFAKATFGEIIFETKD